jgi:hypothetical protein
LILPSTLAAAKTFFGAGLPDGKVSNQKFQFGYILEGLKMENVGIIFMVIWNIVRPFGIFLVIWQ